MSLRFSSTSGEKLTDPENPPPAESDSPSAESPSFRLRQLMVAATSARVWKTVTLHSQDPKNPKPKFDDVGAYDVSGPQEMALWELETKRLMAAVQGTAPMGIVFGAGAAGSVSAPAPGHLDGDNCDKALFERLAALADQILINLHICRLDNELVLHKSKGNRKIKNRPAKSAAMGLSEELLQTRLDSPGNLKSAYRLSNEEEFVQSYFAMVDHLTAVVARFAVSAAEEPAWQCRALAGLARCSAKLKILVRKPEEYISRSIHTVKRYTTEQRVKSVFDNSKSGLQNVAVVVAPEQDLGVHDMMGGGPGLAGGPPGLVAGADHGMWEYGMHPGHFQHWHQEGRSEQSQYAKELELMIETKDESEDPYLANMAIVFRWMSSTLRSVVYGLMAGSPIEAFDIATVTYRAGTTDTPFHVYVHQDRNGELYRGGDPNLIKHAYLGFALVRDAVQTVKMEQEQHKSDLHVRDSARNSGHDHAGTSSKTSSSPSPGGGTSITMQMQDFEPGHEHAVSTSDNNHHGQQELRTLTLELTTLAQIATVMVPLMCTSQQVIVSLQSALSELGTRLRIDVEDRLTPRSPEFTAAVSLRTRRFQEISDSHLPGAEFRSLSHSILVNSARQISHPKMPVKTSAWDDALQTDHIQHRLGQVRERRERLAREGQEWDMEETAVSVSCPRYVYTVLGCAGLLVCGGLAAGFFLGERLEGVDPFNITMFSWLLAGFLILIAKSVRVADWPWRDFLLGRVTCRSLSELSSVTGANEQDLILYLLTKEPESVLITRGPYNRLFNRKEDLRVGRGGGFSMDVKPEVRTLASAGLVFVVVSLRQLEHHEPAAGAGAGGRGGATAIVCLDLRHRGGSSDKGGAQPSARTSIQNAGSEGALACRYPPRPGDRIQDLVLNHEPLYQLVAWNKVLGIYHSPETKVR